MITQDQLKDIASRIEKLKSYLEIDKKLIEITNKEEKTANPDFWNNPKEAEVLMKELRIQKKWVKDYNKTITLNEDLIVLHEFYKEDEVEEAEVIEQFEKTSTFLEDLEFKNMLSEEGDSLSATIQITAGAGGTESCDWVEMLSRMYTMWAEKQGFKLKTLNYQAGDVAGVKTVTIEIDGDYAFGWLKGENGVHRLVRISPFDSNGKRHTTFGSVYVFPVADDSIEIDVQCSPNTLDIGGNQTVDKWYNITLSANSNYASYLWNDNTTKKSIDIKAHLLGAGVYNYSLKATDQYNCAYTDNMTLTVTDLVSIDDASKRTIKVYPTPTKDILQIDLPQSFKGGKLEIINLIGKVVLQKEIEGAKIGTYKLNIAHLPKGAYILKLSTSEGEFNFKIVKE